MSRRRVVALLAASGLGAAVGLAAGSGAASAPIPRAAIVFLGDSLTAEGRWSELFPHLHPVVNLGVSGDSTRELLARIGEVTEARPRWVVLMIGTNDLLRSDPVHEAAARVEEAVRRLTAKSPQTRVVVQSVLPVDEHRHPRFAGFRERARLYNQRLRAAARTTASGRVWYADHAEAFAGPDGMLRPDLTTDGVHLNVEGYRRWAERLTREVPQLRPEGEGLAGRRRDPR